MIKYTRYFVSSIEINLVMTPQFQVFYYNNPEMIFLISLSPCRPFIHLYIESRNEFWATHVQSLKLRVTVVHIHPVKHSFTEELWILL